MSITDTRTTIIHLLQQEQDVSLLDAILKLLRREEVPDEEFTAEELAELDAQRADHLMGKSRSYTAEESLRMIREGSRE